MSCASLEDSSSLKIEVTWGGSCMTDGLTSCDDDVATISSGISIVSKVGSL